MRVTPIETHGHFWLPATVEKVPGILSVGESGESRLELLGLLGGLEGSFNDSKPFRIVGVTQGGEPVTLEGCRYTRTNLSFGGIESSKLYVESTTFGLARESDTTVRYSKFHFYVEGLDEWLGTSGFDFQTGSKTNSEISLALTYSAPKKVELKLEDGTRLSFCFQVEVRRRPPTAFTLTQTAYLTVEPSQEIDLERVMTLITRLVNFFGFAIDATVTLTSLQVNVANWSTADLGDPNKSKRVYYPSLPTSSETPRCRAHEMLFRFKDIESRISILLSLWLTQYENLSAPFELYFAGRFPAKGPADFLS
jgi:hypothetical protein